MVELRNKFEFQTFQTFWTRPDYKIDCFFPKILGLFRTRPDQTGFFGFFPGPDFFGLSRTFLGPDQTKSPSFRFGLGRTRLLNLAKRPGPGQTGLLIFGSDLEPCLQLEELNSKFAKTIASLHQVPATNTSFFTA